MVLLGSLVSGCFGLLDVDADGALADGGDGVAPCLETKTRTAGSRVTTLGFSADEALQYVLGENSSRLTWSTGAETRIRVQVSDARAYVIQSRINPAWDVSQGSRYCVNRMQIEARVVLTSDDGQLNEATDHLLLTTNGADEVYGGFVVQGDQLGGSYRPVFRQQVCYQHLQVKLLFAVDGIHGTLTDHVLAGACGNASARPLSTASARWGVRWRNY